MIEVNGVKKTFGRVTALDGVTFRIGRGEVVGLVGPSGAGKTTLLRLLACYFMPTEGTIRVGGLESTRDSLGIRGMIGYLPEKDPVYSEMRVLEFLSFRSRLKGMAGRHRLRRIRELIARCSLAGLERAMIRGLSRGETRRVLVADCLAADPAVVLMDEPTLGLDAWTAGRIRALMGRGGEERTVVFASHDMDEVESLCGRVLVMNRGRIVADATPVDLRVRFGVPRLADAVSAFGKGAESA